MATARDGGSGGERLLRVGNIHDVCHTVCRLPVKSRRGAVSARRVGRQPDRTGLTGCFRIHFSHPRGPRPAGSSANGGHTATIGACPLAVRHSRYGCRTSTRVVVCYDTLMGRREIFLRSPGRRRASPSAWPGFGSSAPAARYGRGPTAGKRPPRGRTLRRARRSRWTSRRSRRCGSNGQHHRARSTNCCWIGSPSPSPRSSRGTAWVEREISADSDEAARARALSLLGFTTDLPVRIIAA